MNQPYSHPHGAGAPPADARMGQGYAQGYGQGYGQVPGAGWVSPWPAPGIGQISPWNRFVKGALIGAAATYLLTNEQVQRTAIKGAVRVWSLLHGGVEEIKERFGDAAAELHQANQQRDS